MCFSSAVFYVEARRTYGGRRRVEASMKTSWICIADTAAWTPVVPARCANTKRNRKSKLLRNVGASTLTVGGRFDVDRRCGTFDVYRRRVQALVIIRGHTSAAAARWSAADGEASGARD